MKTVTLPIEEYDELLQDHEDKQRLMKELETDAKERGYFVQHITNFWEPKDEGGWRMGYNYITEKNMLMIISKDAVLVKAQKEIERLEQLATELTSKNAKLTAEINILQNRSLWERIINKHD